MDELIELNAEDEPAVNTHSNEKVALTIYAVPANCREQSPTPSSTTFHKKFEILSTTAALKVTEYLDQSKHRCSQFGLKAEGNRNDPYAVHTPLPAIVQVSKQARDEALQRFVRTNNLYYCEAMDAVPEVISALQDTAKDIKHMVFIDYREVKSYELIP
ncbi:hypothetical protein LTR15_011225 [Elasticomyces elasticus]|nr:hypothetical protein LTR15_011225 [Elasticomyces elasticus]